MLKLFELLTGDGTVKAKLTIDAPNVTGAEQDLVVLDESGRALAVVEMQPGIDRKEIEPPATKP
jgi:hypothetical protein